MLNAPYHVLFLCSENACRSIVAEALLNHYGQGRFKAFSAGTEPLGEINPIALELLALREVSTEGLQSKHWSVFTGPNAPQFDIALTITDPLHDQVSPRVPGQPAHAEWGMEDPSRFTASEDVLRVMFGETVSLIEACVKMLIELPEYSLPKIALNPPIIGIPGIITHAPGTLSATPSRVLSTPSHLVG